jgi:hypothetical protein
MSEVVIDSVEYLPETGKYAELRERGPFSYVGIGPRSSDGWTCLTLRASGASRNFNITVGYLYALTVRGKRHVLEVPDERWKIKAEEIRFLIEGKREDWAAPYFDPTSPSYFKHQPGYRSPYDPEHEALRRAKKERPTVSRRAARAEPQPTGCAVLLVLVAVPLLTGLTWLLW